METARETSQLVLSLFTVVMIVHAEAKGVFRSVEEFGPMIQEEALSDAVHEVGYVL